MLNTLCLTLAADSPADHVYNHVFIKLANGFWLWSGNQGNLVLSGIILIFGMLWAAKHVSTGTGDDAESYVTRNPFAHFIEVLCVYLRDEVVEPLLHDRTKALMPFLWTIFFFILVNNLIGLVPIMDAIHLVAPGWKAKHMTPLGGTATQNIWVTGVLAVVAAVVFNAAAISRLGVGNYFKHMTGGAPLLVAPMIFVLEFLGQVLIKPVALAIRLFANMTAGHILLATLLGFVGVVISKSIFVAGPVTIISVLGAFAIMILELFVAFLQAFIFMFLTTVFISLMDHHDEHGHDHEHGHAEGHEHAPAAA
ncbi:MAG: F0F1 ATP synthase subunit A [Planctomycetota bacterium]|nr:MAG: F0F1 ATP synthase subunit A [Planctomycetota bacterium]